MTGHRFLQGVPPCGAGFFLDAQKETKEAPRGRVGEYGHAVSILSRSPASYGSFSTWKRNSPRRAKPCKTRRRGHGPGQLLLPLRGNSPSAPALRGSSNDACSLKRPLIRPLWGRLPLRGKAKRMTAVKSTQKIIHKINAQCGKKEGTSCTCTWASR